MNYADSERIDFVLQKNGYQKTLVEREAETIIVVACSVRQHAVDRIYGKVKEWRLRDNLVTVLTGCLLPMDKKKATTLFDLLLDIKEINQLPNLIKEIKEAKKSRAKISPPDIGKIDYLSLDQKRESSFRAYVPISTGCDNFCSYCAVPYTRGREKSRHRLDIVAEVKSLVTNGYKEIILLGQNVNSYGQDLTDNKKETCEFINLIKEIDKIPGNYRVYFYSNHPKDMTAELVNALAGLKHFPHYLHLPLQSGSDRIIKAMNRHYTQNKYLSLVKKIRGAMPDVALTTDIIVGFPGETESDFAETAKVMEKVSFDMAFIAQYSPRPGTKAEKLLDDISAEEKVRREKILQEILKKSADKKNQQYIGQTLTVLIDGAKKDKLYGRTADYKVVEIKKSPRINIGDFIDVKIESATAWKLLGFFV